MPRAVKSNLSLFADDSCLAFQGEDVIEIEKQLNGDFTNICEWFVDNRLGFHFGKIKEVPKLNTNGKNIPIKQHSKVTYLGCILDETMLGESMALKVINKIN